MEFDERVIIKRCIGAGIKEEDVRTMLAIERKYMKELGIV